MKYPECSIEGCTRPGRARTWCFTHYGRWRHHGDPNVQMQRNHGSATERFWKRVQKGPRCWEWTGYQNADGYGAFSVGDKTFKAHKFSYELNVGPVPDGLMIDHRCRNRTCVNPAHLRPVTYKQNSENRSQKSSNKTGVRNVYFVDGAYRVTVTHNKAKVNGGRFSTLEEAAEAARQLRLSLFTHNDADRRAA